MKHLLSRYGIAVAVLLLLVSCGTEGSKTSGDTSGGLLPDQSELSGYVRSAAPIAYGRDKAWDHLGNDADKWLYNGFQQATAATYKSSGKSGSLTLEIMQFTDPIRAFAIFSYLRQPGARYVELQPLGYMNRDTLVFFNGVHVGRVISSDAAAENEMLRAARAMLEKLSDSVTVPVQLRLFPTEGLIPNSQTVNLDDIEGQTPQSNRFGAKYLSGSDTVQMFLQLSPYGGPSVAVNEFIGEKGQVKDYLLDCNYQALTGQDGEGRFVFCAIDKDVLCTVVGKIDQQAARNLVDKTFALAAKIPRT